MKFVLSSIISIREYFHLTLGMLFAVNFVYPYFMNRAFYFILIFPAFFCFGQGGAIYSQQFGNDTLVEGRNVTLINSQGIVVETYQVKGEKKHGTRKLFNNQGKISQEEKYKNGFLTGTKKFYDAAGNIQLSEDYNYFPKEERSLLHGKQKKYSNGVLISEITYKKNNKEGAFKTYSPKGQLTEKGTYQENLKVGKYTTYDHEGKLNRKENYIVIGPKNKDEGVGNEKKEIINQPTRRSVLHGKCMYYTQGKLTKSVHYKEGVIDGLLTEYYFQPTHVLRLKEEYKDGKRHGKYERYRSNGNLEQKGVFYQEIEVEGKTLRNVYDGEILYYNQNGFLERQENWKNFKKNGIYQRYNQQGVLSYQTHYQDDLKVGKETHWDHDGNKTMEVNYKIIKKEEIPTEVRHGLQRTWKANQLTSEMNYINGLREGVFKEYYPDGTLKEEKAFVNDSLNGKYFTYHSNGKIQRECHYQSNTYGSNYIGWNKNYNEEGELVNAYYGNGKGGNLITKSYQNGQITSFFAHHALHLSYHPNGTLSELVLSNSNYIGFSFFSNGKIRKLKFYDQEGNPREATFTAEGKVLEISYNSRIVEEEETLKEAKHIAQFVPDNWSENRLVSDSVKNGKYILHYSDSSLFSQLNFKNDLPHEEWVIYDAMSKDTLFYAEFHEGKTIGEWIRKRNGGIPLERKTFDEEENLIARTTYYSNGVVNEQIKRNQKEQYFSKTFYENGQVKNYYDNTLGHSFTFKENGDALYSREYLTSPDSLLIIKRYFTEHNQLKDSIAIHVKEKIGLRTYYFPSGQVEFSYQINERERQIGEFKRFYENGQVRIYGWYKEEKKDGEWLTYDEEGNLVESERYKDGELIILPEEEEECACYDKSLPASSIGFAQPVSSFTSFKEVHKLLPPFVYPIDSLNFNSIFFINFQGDYQFASLKLLPMHSMSFHLGNRKGVRIDLLPCQTKGYLNNLQGRFSTQNGRFRYATIDLKRIAVQLESNPLTNALGRPFKGYFDANDLELMDDVLSLRFSTTLNACFPEGKINNTMDVKALKGKPQLDLLSKNTSVTSWHNLPLTNFEQENFNGLIFTEGEVQFSIHRIKVWLDEQETWREPREPSSSELRFEGKVENLATGANWLAGSVILEGTLSEDESTFYLPNQTGEISAKELLNHLTAKGFMRLELTSLGEEAGVRIQFYTEK